MVFGFGSKPTPALVANGTKRQFNQKTFNNASIQLKNALSTIANQHVLKYANAIRVNAKAQANAARATAVAAAAPTPNNVTKAVTAANNAAAAHKNMIQSENDAAAVVKAVPTSGPVSPAAQNAEVQAINSVGMLLRNIASYQTLGNLNKVKNNQRFQNASNNNRRRITQAVNAKRATLESIL